MDWLDWNAVNWSEVVIYSVITFLAALFAQLINSLFNNNPLVTALLAAFFFIAGYIAWNHYPHGINIGQQQTETAPVN